MSDMGHEESTEMPGWCSFCGTRWPCSFEEWRQEALQMTAERDAARSWSARWKDAAHLYLRSISHWQDALSKRTDESLDALNRMRAERDGLAVENQELRAALKVTSTTWHRGILHMSEPPFMLRSCKYECCRTADAILGRPASTRGAELMAAAQEMADAIGDCGRPVTDDQLTSLIERYFAWRALHAAPAAGGDGEG